jgi:adenylate cyclase
MGQDEAATLAALKADRAELIDPKASQYNGRTIKLMGDGSLMEFPSVVEAVTFAVEVQLAMSARNADLPEDRQIHYRIGINIGDIIVEGDDIYGDGVNIAARLEGLAEAGGICVRRNVRNQVRDKLDLDYEDRGEIEVKNIARPIRVFSVVLDDKAEALATPVVAAPIVKGGRRRPAIAAVLVLGLVAAGGLAWWQPWAPNAEPASSERMTLALPGRHSIAVLPFANISGDKEQEYFVDGMTDDLITRLSKLRALTVIARNSVFTYKGRNVKVQDVARDLGVRYVLEGSVRRAGGVVRINAQLIDTETGGHLWAEIFDRDFKDIFALQDEVTAKIVDALKLKLTPLEVTSLAEKSTQNMEAYDLLLRGLEPLHRYNQDDNGEARRYFERAVAIDPNYARAYANIAYTLTLDILNGWTQDSDSDLERATELIQTAIALNDSIPQIYLVRSVVYRVLRKNDEAIAAARRAIELNPNYVDGYGALAITLNYAGRADEGLTAIRRAMHLSPHFSFFYIWIAGQAYFLQGRYDEAIAELTQVVERNPQFRRGHQLLAAAYAQSGDIDNAEWEAEEILSLSPDFSLAAERQRAPYMVQTDLDRYIDGLRIAGLPE